MQLFKLDSPLMQHLSKAADLIIINILWLLCCIPVVTIGASTTAMYRFCMEMAMNREPAHPMQHFFRTFRSEFKCATMVNLILLVPAVLIGINVWMLAMEWLNSLFLILFACLIPLVVLMAVLCYVYGYIAFFADPPLTCIRNAFVLALAYFPRTVLMLLLSQLPVGILVLSPELFAKAVIWWLLIGFSFTAYLKGFLLRKIFRNYMPEEEDKPSRSDN